MSEDIMNYEQVAKLLDLKVTTLYSLVSKGRIPHIKVGRRFIRFSKSRIMDWLKKNEKEVKA